jgi:hypothetical protein
MLPIVRAHPHRNKIKWGHIDCISVKPQNGPVEYYSVIRLSNVTFKVSESGRIRAYEDGVRNVHAWAVGNLVSGNHNVKLNLGQLHELDNWTEVTYSPNHPTFVYKDGEAYNAKEVILAGKYCWAKGVNWKS